MMSLNSLAPTFKFLPCNTAFFKMPSNIINQQGFLNLNYASKYAYFEPPLKRIQEFRFKFRYHDGTLVDFGTEDITFTHSVAVPVIFIGIETSTVSFAAIKSINALADFSVSLTIAVVIFLPFYVYRTHYILVKWI